MTKSQQRKRELRGEGEKIKLVNYRFKRREVPGKQDGGKAFQRTEVLGIMMIHGDM